MVRRTVSPPSRISPCPCASRRPCWSPCSIHGGGHPWWISGWIAGVLLGFAVLAKAFLPVALFAPVWLIARGKRLAIAAGAILIAGPWHLLVWLRNGSAFWDVYFWQQQVGRFNSPALHHGQPFWFYVPVLLLGLFPWTPLFALVARRETYDDVRVSSLAIWLALAVIFLSVFANKLPGYLLSLLPAVAIVLAVALDKAPKQEWWIAACALALILLPSAAAGLPDAFLSGATKAKWPFHPAGLLFVLPAAAVWWMAWRKMTALAVLSDRSHGRGRHRTARNPGSSSSRSACVRASILARAAGQIVLFVSRSRPAPGLRVWAGFLRRPSATKVRSRRLALAYLERPERPRAGRASIQNALKKIVEYDILDRERDHMASADVLTEQQLTEQQYDATVRADIELFRNQANQFLAGEITDDQFRAFRLRRGIYGQRQQGVQMIRTKVPGGLLTADQMRATGAASPIDSAAARAISPPARTCSIISCRCAQVPDLLHHAGGCPADHARSLLQHRPQRHRLPACRACIPRKPSKSSPMRGAWPSRFCTRN